MLMPLNASTHSSDASGVRRGPILDMNPYIAARREWDERYGSLISRARNWRLVGMLCASAVLLQTAGLITLSMRSHVIPYIVAVDGLGRQVAAGPAEHASVADDRLRRAVIFDWIGDLRLVTNDGIAQRKAIDRVYAHIANGSQAMGFINDFYRSDPPQKRAETETVNVEVQSVLPTSEKTFEVEWVETTRDLQGQVTEHVRWRGAFSLAVNPPTEERLVRVNPLGVYVTNASWSKVL